MYDPRVAPWSRVSLDDAEVLRSPTFATRGDDRRRVERAHDGAKLAGSGKDKRLAEAAKDMIETLARKTQGIGHKRKPCADQESHSRPQSPLKGSTIISPQHVSETLPSAGTLAGGGGGERPRARKIVDLPPRSDSRNAFATPASESSTPRRSPARAVTPPKPIKPTLRPNSPPSISIPPLKPHTRPDVCPVLPLIDRSAPPFHALVVSLPFQSEICTRDAHEVLVQIDAGGSSLTTTLATLCDDGRGGKLGKFVEARIEELRSESSFGRGDERKRHHDKAVPGYLSLPMFATILDHGQGSNSSLSVSPSHFNVSPGDSPFPFTSDLSADGDDGDDGDDGIDCCSPIDPRAPQLFLSLPSFTAPPPPLRFDLDPLPASHQVSFVASPAPGSKHVSVHATISSPRPSLSPSYPELVSPLTPRRPKSSSFSPLSARSFSYDGPSGPASPNELAARKALAKRLHLSTTSLEARNDQALVSRGGETFFGATDLESLFGAFRSSSRRQASREGETTPSASFFAEGGDGPVSPRDSRVGARVGDPCSPLVETAEEFPLDIVYDPEPPNGTIVIDPCLNPRQRAKKSTTKDNEEEPTEPIAAPKESFGTSQLRDQRPPSLTTSESTARTTESDYPPSREPRTRSPTTTTTTATTIETKPPRICIFLDRTDATLPTGFGSTYSTILSFLRDRALPPHLTSPRSDDESDDEEYLKLIKTVSSGVAFSQLAALRTVELEADWLGMSDLVAACKRERRDWIEALRAVESDKASRSRPAVDPKRQGDTKRKCQMRERELLGWI